MYSIYITPIDSSIYWYPLWKQHNDGFPSIQLQMKSSKIIDAPICDEITISTIHSDLQSIIDNGIGYSDAVGYVAFPLIIALFAFSFTFLFSTINDVNKRYKSKRISLLFEKSFAYRVFMLMSGVSVLYMVAFAGLSLWKNSVWDGFLHSCGSVIGVIIAGMYAFAVLCFVKKCIVYNKPVHLIAEIKSVHKCAHVRIPVRLFLQRCKNWIVGLFHGKGYKEFSDWGYRLNESGLIYSADLIFIDQLADLTKYALDTNDTSLVYSIFETLDVIIAKEKEAINNGWYRKKTIVDWSNIHRLTFQYYEQILESSNPRWDEQVEESFVWRLLGAFSKCKYLNSVDIYFLFKYLQKLMTCGRISLINKYIDKSKYYFSFLPKLSDVAYVKGATEEELKDVESESYNNWCELRDYHLLVAAYWIAEGEYRLLPELLHDQSYRSVYLYPIHSADILYRYQQCKQRVSEDGRYFDYKTADELFGKKLDLNAILDKYATLLLLLCHDDKQMPKQGVKEIEIEQIEKLKPCMAKYVKTIKEDLEVIRLFPDVQNADFEKIYDEGLKCLTDFYPKPKVSWCPFGKKTDSFTQSLDPQAKLQIEHLFHSALQHRLNFIRGFWDCALNGKDKELKVGPLKTTIGKDALVKPLDNFEKGFPYASSELDVVVSRLMYLILCFVDSSSLNTKVVKNYNLEDFVIDFIKDNEDDYVLIDVGDHNSVLLNPRYDGNEQYFNKKTLYLSVDEARYSHLTDFPLYEKYKQSILIIRKSNLPALKLTELSISYKDISSKKDGVYAVELIVNIGMTLCYSEGVEIMCVNPVK